MLAALEPIEHLRFGFKDLPSGQIGEDINDVAPQNPDIQVLMGAGLIPEEQIECPPTGNPPRTGDSGQQCSHFVRTHDGPASISTAMKLRHGRLRPIPNGGFYAGSDCRP